MMRTCQAAAAPTTTISPLPVIHSNLSAWLSQVKCFRVLGQRDREGKTIVPENSAEVTSLQAIRGYLLK